MKKSLLIIAVLLLTGCKLATNQTSTEITNFKDCLAAGNPAMESYPRQCRTEDGKTFTEELGIEDECRVAGGNWLPDFTECENVGFEWCAEKGGTFNECASACRNDPEAEICTMQCVLVCEF